MAKEFPYFKFFVSEWSDGDVSLEDYEVQGAFISLCSYYWSCVGEVTLDKANKKIRNANAMQTLFDSNIIKKNGDKIVINFLDEQFKERLEKSKNASLSANKRWNKYKRNANAMQTHSEGNANAMLIREEKRREEEKKTVLSFFTDENFKEEGKGDSVVLGHRIFRALRDELRPNDKMIYEVSVAEWVKPLRDLLEHYTIEQIREVLNWSGQDDFWKKKISGPDFIKKNFETMKNQYHEREADKKS